MKFKKLVALSSAIIIGSMSLIVVIINQNKIQIKVLKSEW